MAGALRKTMVYLGLAEDELYDDVEAFDDEGYDDPEPRRGESRGGQVMTMPGHSLTRVPAAAPPVELARITTVHPRTYNEAKTIGEAFRDGIPVIMNLTDLDDADAKRLVDFAAGLIFGLHGAIERVTSKVFLLSPAHVEITAEDAEPAAAPGFFNQS